MLRVEQDDNGVGRIVLDRPEARNALTIEMRDGIIDAVREFRADPSVRAVMITGAGDAFCAGMDLSRRRSRRPGSPGSRPVRSPKRCAPASRRSSASSGSSTSRRSPP